MYTLLDRDFDRLVDRLFSPVSHTRPNTTETEEDYMLTLEIPGIPQNEIDISLDGDILRLSAFVSQDKAVDGVERKLDKAWSLPKSVSHEDITATCKDGILLLKLPKMKKEPVKTIPILS